MVAAQVAVVAHSSRTLHPNLTSIADTILWDDGTLGATRNHQRALRSAGARRTIILEDDALPVPGFRELAAAWIEKHPDDLISFYLGTGHPKQWMAQVDAAWNRPVDVFEFPQLFHGVAYTMPPQHARLVADDIDPARPADFAIGEAWTRLTGRPVIYPRASLADHADHTPVETISRGPRRPRRARQLGGTLA